MPGNVTGTFGAEDVVLNNAATESTLILLLEAMNKMAKAQGRGATGAGGDKTSKEAEEVQKLHNKGLKETNDQTKKNLKQQKDTNKLVKDFNTVMTGAIESIGKMATGLDSVARTVGKSFELAFSQATPTIEGFAGAFESLPMVGGIVGSFGRILGSQVNTFRMLSGAGIDLGDSLFSAQLAAAQAGLPLEVFAKTVSENSEMLSLMAGGASQGAQAFGNVAAQMKKNGANAQLAKLGFSMDEIAQGTASYLEIQTRLGRAQNMTQEQLAAGAEQYNLELDKLSRATGIQRRALDEANRKMMADARMRNALSKLNEKDRVAISGFMTQLEKVDPQNAQGLKDLIATGGIATTEAARNLAQASPELVQFAKNVSNGTASAEDMAKAVQATAKRADGLSDSQKRLGQITMTAGQQTYLSSLMGFQGMQKFGAGLSEAEKTQKAALESNQKAAAGLDQSLTDIRNAFLAAFVKTGLLDKMAIGLSAIVTALGKVATVLADFITDINNFGIVEAVTKLFNKIPWGDIGKSLADLFTNPKTLQAMAVGIGALFAAAAVKKALTDSVGNLVSGAASKMTFGGKAPGAATAAGKIGEAGKGSVGKSVGGGMASAMTGLGKGATALGKGLGGGLEGLLKGVAGGLSALANPAALIGLGAATLAINGMALAFRLAGPAMEPFGRMIKSIFEGTKPLLDGLAEAFKGLGAAVKSVFEGIGTVITAVGNAIAAPIKAISDGIGNVVGKLSEYKTASINATTDQIERLSRIPAQSFKDTALGIKEMSAALDGFGPGVFSALGDGFKKLVSGDTVGQIIKLGEAGPGLRAAALGVKEFDASKLVIKGADVSQTDAIVASITKIKNAMKGLEPSLMQKVSDSFVAMLGAGSKAAQMPSTAVATTKATAPGASLAQKPSTAVDTTKTTAPGASLAQNKNIGSSESYTWSDAKFAEKDRENYEKYVARRNEIYKEKLKELSGKGRATTLDRKLAVADAEKQARGEFGQQAAAAGAKVVTPGSNTLALNSKDNVAVRSKVAAAKDDVKKLKSDQLKEQQAAIKAKEEAAKKDQTKPDAAKTPETALASVLNDKLDQLNNTMLALLETAEDQKGIGKRTLVATRESGRAVW